MLFDLSSESKILSNRNGYVLQSVAFTFGRAEPFISIVNQDFPTLRTDHLQIIYRSFTDYLQVIYRSPTDISSTDHLQMDHLRIIYAP